MKKKHHSNRGRGSRSLTFLIIANALSIWAVSTPVLADPVILPLVGTLMNIGLAKGTAFAFATFVVNSTMFNAASWSPARIVGRATK